MGTQGLQYGGGYDPGRDPYSIHTYVTSPPPPLPSGGYTHTFKSGDKLGRDSHMNTFIKTAKIKAGYVGQVILNDSPEGDIVWESKPRKNPEKALAAAQLAQKQAVLDMFDYVEDAK